MEAIVSHLILNLLGQFSRSVEDLAACGKWKKGKRSKHWVKFFEWNKDIHPSLDTYHVASMLHEMFIVASWLVVLYFEPMQWRWFVFVPVIQWVERSLFFSKLFYHGFWGK